MENQEENVNKFLVYLCYEWKNFESCIQFYIEISKGEDYSNDEIVAMIIHDHDGMALMDDGSVVNLMQFVQSYIYKQSDDYTYGEEDDTESTDIKPSLRVVH